MPLLLSFLGVDLIYNWIKVFTISDQDTTKVIGDGFRSERYETSADKITHRLNQDFLMNFSSMRLRGRYRAFEYGGISRSHIVRSILNVSTRKIVAM